MKQNILKQTLVCTALAVICAGCALNDSTDIKCADAVIPFAVAHSISKETAHTKER